MEWTSEQLNELFQEVVDEARTIEAEYGISKRDTKWGIYPHNEIADVLETWSQGEIKLTQDQIQSICTSANAHTYNCQILNNKHIVIGLLFNVVMPYGAFAAFIYDNKLSYESAKKYMMAEVRHEIGHMLDYRARYIGMNSEAVEQAVYIITSKINKFMKKYIDMNLKPGDPGYDDFLKEYYGRKHELTANNYVGLTWEDFKITKGE